MDQNHVQTHAGPYSLSVFYKLSTRFDYALLKWNYLIICWGEALLLIGTGSFIYLAGDGLRISLFSYLWRKFLFRQGVCHTQNHQIHGSACDQ